MHKYVEYCKIFSEKNYKFFNKTQIKYAFLIVKNIKIHILLKNSNFFGRDSYNIMNFSAKFYLKI